MRKADVEVCGMQVNININAFHELVHNLDEHSGKLTRILKTRLFFNFYSIS